MKVTDFVLDLFSGFTGLTCLGDTLMCCINDLISLFLHYLMLYVMIFSFLLQSASVSEFVDKKEQLCLLNSQGIANANRCTKRGYCW